jgi:hypothetical protein
MGPQAMTRPRPGRFTPAGPLAAAGIVSCGCIVGADPADGRKG